MHFALLDGTPNDIKGAWSKVCGNKFQWAPSDNTIPQVINFHHSIVFKASLDTVNTYWKGPLPVVGGNKVESVKDCCACVAPQLPRATTERVTVQ